MPRFSDDDVIDFMVTEAILERVEIQAEKEDKAAEVAAWKKGAAELPG